MIHLEQGQFLPVNSGIVEEVKWVSHGEVTGRVVIALFFPVPAALWIEKEAIKIGQTLEIARVLKKIYIV